MDHLAHISLFEFFDVLDGVPILACSFSVALLFVEDGVVVLLKIGSLRIGNDFVERHLFHDISLGVDHHQIEEISLPSVDADNVANAVLLDELKSLLIELLGFGLLEIQINRHMEFVLVTSESTVFSNIVAKGAMRLMLLIVAAFVFDGHIGFVYNGVFDAHRSEKDFGASIEFIHHIAQIIGMEHHIPIDGV